MNKRRTQMTLNIAYLHNTLLHTNVHSTDIETYTYTYVCVCKYVCACTFAEQIKDGGMNERRTSITLNIAYLHYTLIHKNKHTTFIDTCTYTESVCVCVCVCTYLHSSVENKYRMAAWTNIAQPWRSISLIYTAHYCRQCTYYILKHIHIYSVCVRVCVCVCMYLPAQRRTEQIIDGDMNERRTPITLNIAYLHYTLLQKNVHTTYIDT